MSVARGRIETVIRRVFSRQVFLWTAGIVCGGSVIVQLLYPLDRLIPYSVIDGVAVGGWEKKDAAWELDNRYSEQPVDIYFGDNTEATLSPKPQDLGIEVSNAARVEALTYPWYMRLIPASLFWYKPAVVEGPTYHRDEAIARKFVKSQLGSACSVKPVNASLQSKDDQVVVVPAKTGGICESDDVEKAISEVSPKLETQSTAHVAVQEILPKISDATATRLADTINKQLDQGIDITAGTAILHPDKATVVSWLTFTSNNQGITVAIDTKKSETYFDKEIAPKVALSPGTSHVTTRDFVEVARVNGRSGRSLDYHATGAQIVDYLRAKRPTVSAVTTAVAPKVSYTRTYSPTDTGLSALIKHYAEDHKGTYGIQLIELSGKRRRAAYNEGRQFVTASTYKLFVAYSTLRRIESGKWHWSDQINGGRDLAACFDDMIVKSDNACAEALLEKITFRAVTNEAHELGCTSTTFLESPGIKTTAADLGLFLASLHSGQMLDKQSSRDRLIGAMKRNIYRQGIPAGASGVVADKVGFLNDLLHDAAIVYSPNGTYALAIMTDKSSWANIADLTKKIESLRNS